MIDFLILALLVLMVGGILFYVIRQKKKGKTCIGCPCSGSCKGKCSEKEK